MEADVEVDVELEADVAAEAGADVAGLSAVAGAVDSVEIGFDTDELVSGTEGLEA